MYYVLSFNNNFGEKRYFNRFVMGSDDDWYDCDSLVSANKFKTDNAAERMCKKLNAIVEENKWYGKYHVEFVA